MAEKKSYEVPVARVATPSGVEILVAQIPWEHFCAPLVLRGYHQAYVGTGMPTVIIAKEPSGKWHDYTLADADWSSIKKHAPPESLPWHSMPVECEAYPWEYRET